MKKKWPIFLVLSSVVNLKGQFIKLHEVFLSIILKLYDHLCNTQEVVESTNFWKEINLSSEKNQLTDFSRFIEY